MAEFTTAEEIKKKANEYFISKNYAQAEELYSFSLESFPNENTAIIHTNRSAARFHLEKFEGALADAESALLADRTWTKAYFRKASALEKLSRQKEAFETWNAAIEFCNKDTWLLTQYKAAFQKWTSIFREASQSIESPEDLKNRFNLLPNKRERLSTLAHFWNDSLPKEREGFFHTLIDLIKGLGDLSELTKSMTEDNMVAMPLHNYEDLPRARIAPWVDYFRDLPFEGKAALFQGLWASLSSEEQSDVILDLQLLLNPESQRQQQQDDADN